MFYKQIKEALCMTNFGSIYFYSPGNFLGMMNDAHDWQI